MFKPDREKTDAVRRPDYIPSLTVPPYVKTAYNFFSGGIIKVAEQKIGEKLDKEIEEMKKRNGGWCTTL